MHGETEFDRFLDEHDFLSLLGTKRFQDFPRLGNGQPEDHQGIIEAVLDIVESHLAGRDSDAGLFPQLPSCPLLPAFPEIEIAPRQREGSLARLDISANHHQAGVDRQEVDAINAHGTGTQANDQTETAAIRAVFGVRAHRIPISATKALHGHLLGAAGALECVLALLAMRNEVALPTMHLRTPDPDCDLDYVANAARAGVAARTMLSNSFAFGGTNAVLVLGAAH